MHWTRILPALAMLVLLGAGMASAQTVLRIGLNDDPDALDPTISRAYVGRLVFAALCDKLFDVTPDLKIVPQLATGYEWAAGGRSVVIRLRPGVKFHDGEPFNAEAVRFNIERHLSTPGSFRKSEIGEIEPHQRDDRDRDRGVAGLSPAGAQHRPRGQGRTSRPRERSAARRSGSDCARFFPTCSRRS